MEFSYELLVEIAETYARLVKTFDALPFRQDYMLLGREKYGDVLFELDGFYSDLDFNHQLYRARRILKAAGTEELLLYQRDFPSDEEEWYVSFVDPPVGAANFAIDGYVPPESEIIFKREGVEFMPMEATAFAGFVPELQGNDVVYKEIVRIDFEGFRYHRNREAEEGYNRTLFTRLFESLYQALSGLNK